MRNWEFNVYEKLIKKTEADLHSDLYRILVNYYGSEKVKYNTEYLYAYGNIPVALVAHLDTVFRDPPQAVYYDRKNSLIYSPEGGVGDDRAGVFAILKILIDGYRPTVIFTCGEEWGGVGASLLVKDYENCPNDIKYFIELDRRGIQDCVFYDCENEEFTTYVKNFGFQTAMGSFSDISIICPSWKIAGVNLSIGYFNEHSDKEFLLTEAWRHTIKKVEKMLSESNIAPYFKYMAAKDKTCDRCGKSFPFLEYAYDNNKRIKVCWNCLNQSSYCYGCGENFFPKEEDDLWCEECLNKDDYWREV